MADKPAPIEVPWLAIACPTCQAPPGQKCTNATAFMQEATSPCHMSRHNAAKARLPEAIKARIIETYCPTCRAYPGDQCDGSDGTWWHRARDVLILEQHARPPAKATKTFLIKCPECDADPGMPCLTVDYTENMRRRRGHMGLSKAAAKSLLPKKKFHQERHNAAAEAEGLSAMRMPLNIAYDVKCPVCGVEPGNKCLRTSVDTEDGFRKLAPEERNVESRRPHWPRWHNARRELLALGDAFVLPKIPKLPPAAILLDTEESCAETGLHAELME